MKGLFILFTLLLLSFATSAQELVEAISKSRYVNITRDPPKPPYLLIKGSSLQFIDTDKNLKIDANESTNISFQLRNTGYGPGLNLKVSVTEINNIPSLVYAKLTDIGKLEVGEFKQIQIPLTAGMNLPDGKAIFRIMIEEANGFDSDPLQIEIETKSFSTPLIKVVDYKIISKASKILERRKPFELQVLIQNVGEGKANYVSVRIPVPEGVFCLSNNDDFVIETLEAGEQYLAEYTFVTNTEYSANTIPIEVVLSESYKKYAESENIILKMNQNVSNTSLVIEGKEEIKSIFVIGSLTSSVDKNIPENKEKFPNRIALVIGNENYNKTLNSEINVVFARNDAEVFKRYCSNVLGIEERNIFFLLDATAGQMRKEIDRVTELMKRFGDSGELIFYYAGHGFPDEITKIPYLIPVDVDATNLYAAIKLSEVYNKFGNTGASRITLFLDACFTGGGRKQGLLAARGVVIKPNTEDAMGNMVVFSATSGEQSALPYLKEQHGMFTYFLLEKLQATNGNISYGELASYIRKKVGIESLRENGKPQDPEITISNSIISEWENWYIK